MDSQRKKPNLLIIGLVTLPVLGFMIWNFSTMFQSSDQYYNNPNFVEATGTITEVFSSRGRRARLYAKVDFVAEDGKTYSAQIDGGLGALSEGQEIQLYYDRENPNQAISKEERSLGKWLWLLIPISIGVSAFYVYQAYQKQKREKT